MTENVLSFLYETVPGRLLLRPLTGRFVSKLCGLFLDSRLSLFLVPGFIRRHHISLDLCEPRRFRSFNECFTRRLLPAARPVDRTPSHLISPCDGLLSVYPIQDDLVIPVKQSSYTIKSLLRSGRLARHYRDGLCLVFRLRTDHYHRYCYVDSGCKGKNYSIPGRLHTVRPIALSSRPVFAENCRSFTIIKSENFGPVIQMEVGAMLVGKIVNHHDTGYVKRGEEKGYFKYGGSTIIVLLQKNRAAVASAFPEATAAGRETPVVMGQSLTDPASSDLTLQRSCQNQCQDSAGNC